MTSAEAAPALASGGIGGAARRAEELAERAPVLAVGLVISILTWFVAISDPDTGLDQGWIAGMYMGIEHGIRFGPDFVFTYGPLGFLNFATGTSAWPTSPTSGSRRCTSPSPASWSRRCGEASA